MVYFEKDVHVNTHHAIEIAASFSGYGTQETSLATISALLSTIFDFAVYACHPSALSRFFPEITIPLPGMGCFVRLDPGL